MSRVKWAGFCHDSRLSEEQDSWVQVYDHKGDAIFKSQGMSWNDAARLVEVMNQLKEAGFQDGVDTVRDGLDSFLERQGWNG